MKEFPNIINVKNKNHFSLYYNNTVMCYLRKEIYEHIIREDENTYFDLDKFGRVYFENKKNREEILNKLVDDIIPEITNLGWNCKRSFGGTALFIYSTEKPPPSCWDDGL
jgi:hypothetical protein